MCSVRVCVSESMSSGLCAFVPGLIRVICRLPTQLPAGLSRAHFV